MEVTCDQHGTESTAVTATAAIFTVYWTVAQPLFKMSSSDPRSFNPPLTIDERNDVRQSIAKAEAEQIDIRQSISKAWEELKRHSIRQKNVTNNISQLKQTLVIHRVLPREIMDYIFTILCTEKISIPHKKNMTPPQITVSHVCSGWREVALTTPALWNDVEITKPDCNKWVRVATELFDRAGMRRINLALDMAHISSDNDIEEIFYDIVLPLHVKKLHLTLPLSELENLSQNSDDIIANIDEIALSFSVEFMPSIANLVSITPHFLSKIRSLTVLEWGHQLSFLKNLDLVNLPWAQMRHLCCNIILTLPTISDILRQSPLLNVCGIQVELNGDEAEPTTVSTLPQLRIFHIVVYHPGSRRGQDKVLRSFRCPNLTDFRLEIVHSSWTPETYRIIQDHYNLHRLLRFETSSYPYPISKVLFDAPMLQELILREKIFINEGALQGVASGELGRCLTSLYLGGNFSRKRVLDMVASRQRHVKQTVEASRSWQDQQISGIKRIRLLNYGDVKDDVLAEELEDELKKLGVIMYFSDEFLSSHPLSVLEILDEYF